MGGEVSVGSFSDGLVWNAKCQLRLVSPQLDSQTLTQEPLSDLESLELRIEQLEKQMGSIRKFLVF